VDTLFPLALVISLLVDYHGFIYNMTSLLLPGLLLVRRHPRAAGYLWVCAAATLAIAFARGAPFGLAAPLFLGIAIWIGQGSAPERVSGTTVDRYQRQGQNAGVSPLGAKPPQPAS
jgi:hypothetical protein